MAKDKLGGISGSRASTEPASSLRPSGFDPGRIEDAWNSATLDKRLQIIGIFIAHHTGNIKYHADGLESARHQLAETMKMLEEVLGEVEEVATNPFARN